MLKENSQIKIHMYDSQNPAYYILSIKQIKLNILTYLFSRHAKF